MELGAIVEYEGHRWRVCKLHRTVRTVTLVRWGGTSEEIADDTPEAKVVADPRHWPVVTARIRPNAGPLVRLSLTRRGRARALTPLVHWVPSDFERAGGSVFLHPQLKLVVGEILVAEHKDGSSSRIQITKRYGSMAQRRIVRSGLTEKKGLMDFLEGEEFVE